ncbi:hypothetical protein AHAS_Ahas20G0236900 [Arachis hypogaea]
MFQLGITISIFVINILNYFFAKMKHGEGWRYNLHFAAILVASESSMAVKHPWATLLKRHYRLLLVMIINSILSAARQHECDYFLCFDFVQNH